MNRARVFGIIVIAAVAGATYASAAEAPAGDLIRIGRRIQDFSLKNHFGKEHALHDFADRDVVVVAFIGTECPLAQLYGPRLAELAKKVGSRRVAIVGIDSNQQDSIQEIGAYAREINADLVVVGHRRQSTLARWWSGASGAHLVDYVGCSLLIGRNQMSTEAFSAEFEAAQKR